MILGQRHLERVLREFIAHYDAKRPHRGLRLAGYAYPSGMSFLYPTGSAIRDGARVGPVLGPVGAAAAASFVSYYSSVSERLARAS